MSRGHVWGGVRHGGRCACERCDPKQILATAARAAAKLAPPPAPAPAPRPAGGPPVVRYARPGSARTARLREHLRAGKTFAESAQLIEAEFSQPPKGTLHAEKTDRTIESDS